MIFQVETFKKLHGEDQMAVDKLKEGIDGFAKDQVKLEQMVHEIVENSEHWLGPHFKFIDAHSCLCCFHTGKTSSLLCTWHFAGLSATLGSC